MEQKYITDKQGNKVLPITHVNAVRDDNGNTISSLFGAYKDSVNDRLDTQDAEIELLNGSEVIVVANHTAVTSPDSQKIYREQGTTSYIDWMYYDNAWKQIAEYSFPGTDDEPTAGSENLVKSGGVFNYTFIHQIPKNNLSIERNKAYNSQLQIISYNGFDIYFVTLTGSEVTVTSLNKATIGGVDYKLDNMFIFYDNNDTIIGSFGGKSNNIGKFLTAIIPANCTKIGIQTYNANIYENQIIFGYNNTYNNYNGFVQPMLVAGNGENNTVTISNLTLIAGNGFYTNPSKRVTFTIDGSLSTYLMSSSNPEYKPYYYEIESGNTASDFYILKIPLWDISQMKIDTRDILYHEGVKGGILWPWISAFKENRIDIAFNQVIVIDDLFKKDFLQGISLNNCSFDIGHGYNSSGAAISHDSFFITYINLKGNEKTITALNRVTLSSVAYAATPLFVFYDSNNNIIEIFNGTNNDKGKFISRSIPNGCVKVGVNCGRNDAVDNRITVSYNTNSSKIINCLGDSITAQLHYTDALISLGYTINNYGVSGTTISTIQQRNYFKSRVSKMTDNCDAVIVFGGINDWQLGAPLGEKFETTDESKFYPALNELFITLKNKYVNKPIYVCTPLHSQFHLEGYADKMEYTENNNLLVANKYGNGDILSKYVQAIKDMAQLYSIQVIDLYSESGMAALIPSNKAAYYIDGLHPNAAGGILIAKCIDKYLSM